MNIFLFDASTIGLIVLLIISIYGFGLFWWYWNRKGKATEAYVYMMGVYGGGIIIMGFGVYARYLAVVDDVGYHALMYSKLWAVRLVPLIVWFFIITFRLTIKAYRAVKYEKDKKSDRREGG